MSAPSPTRRGVLAAPLALSALAGCDGPDEFGHPLHGRGRGVASEEASFATVLDLDGLGRGVLVRTRGGHAIKVEGNPRHPASLGASDVFLEAAPLALHDPARSRRALHRGRAADAAGAFAAMAGPGTRLLTGPVSSPTLRRLIAAWLDAAPGRAWHVHDPMAEPAAAAGALAAFGRAAALVPDIAAARAVLCLGADPLGHGPAQLALARAWRQARPRLLVAEAAPSLSGARADLRLPLHPAEGEALLRAVATLLGVPGLAATAAHPAAAALADALRAAGDGALVLAGREATAPAHALAHAINRHLGSRAARLTDPPLGEGQPVAALLAAMRAGQVPRLAMLDADPVAELPGFRAALALVPETLHLGARPDATAQAAAWHLPMAHPLESWGDSLAFDGTPAIRQPVAEPGARIGPVAALLALLGTPGPERVAVRDTWRAAWGEAGFEDRWEAALEDGTCGPPAPALDLPLLPGWDRPGAAAAVRLAAILAPDPHLRAGAFAHEAWLHELPRPLTGLAWGNAVLVPPELGLAPGEEVEVSLGPARIAGPAWPLAGQAPGTVTLPLGGGRRAGGPVGEAALGFDAAPLRPADGGWVAHGVALRRTGRRLPLVARAPRPALLGAESVKVVAPGRALPPPRVQPSLHPPWPSPAAAWGMTIDLDACIGCNACAAACQAENNVPVVGPAAASQGRALHWLRVDAHPRPHGGTAFQPVPCMQCEQAPCEPVCPVNATVHDHEGLNAMVPARCIGTRTCANACPYGVRRFNWADHRSATDTPARNPDVALRPRGVMEKCTYCTHRIAAARTAGTLDALETACQRACPTRAIAFGDLKDADGAAARGRRDGRAYLLLEELGTRPRTAYLARVEDGA